MNKKQYIELLSLNAHPSEGGYFNRTYTSDIDIKTDSGERKTFSCIYYMLTDDSPVGYLHKNKSDIIHYYHAGGPIQYFILHPDGQLEKTILGNDIASGHVLQLVVKGGCWKASELLAGEYGLISEAVTPGFDYEDMMLADKKTIRETCPAHYEEIKRFIKN